MVGAEVLRAHSPDHIPELIVIADIVHGTISVLGKALLTHEVALLERTAVRVLESEAELGKLVVEAELIIVAVTVGVVQREVHVPVLIHIPHG